MKIHPKSSQQASVLLRTGLAGLRPVLLLEEGCTKKKIETCLLFAVSLYNLHLPLKLTFERPRNERFSRFSRFVGSHKNVGIGTRFPAEALKTKTLITFDPLERFSKSQVLWSAFFKGYLNQKVEILLFLVCCPNRKADKLL